MGLQVIFSKNMSPDFFVVRFLRKNGDFIKNGDLASLEVVSHVHLVPRPTKKIPNYPTRGDKEGLYQIIKVI